MLLLGGREELAQLGHLGRVAAERAAELVDEVPRGAIHVEHGREVDIEADTAQVVRAQAALSGRLGPRVSGLADLLRRQDRLPRQPLDLAALLVRHEQQRLAHRVARAGVGALELLDDRREVRPGADVAGEEDDPGYLAVPDQLEQAGRRGEAGVAVDHALAGQLSHGELRQHGLGRGEPGRARRDGTGTQSDGGRYRGHPPGRGVARHAVPVLTGRAAGAVPGSRGLTRGRRGRGHVPAGRRMARRGGRRERDAGGEGHDDADAERDQLVTTHRAQASPGAGQARPALALSGERTVTDAWGCTASRVHAGGPDF